MLTVEMIRECLLTRLFVNIDCVTTPRRNFVINNVYSKTILNWGNFMPRVETRGLYLTYSQC